MPGKAVLIPAVVAHTEALRAHAAGLATVTPAWAAPPPAAPYAGDPLDVAGMTAAFDRTAVDQAVAAVYADPAGAGTVGDAAALKLQNDVVAARERAYRLRQSSPVRCAAHAAARSAGHGHPAGVWAGVVLRYLQDAVRQGGAA